MSSPKLKIKGRDNLKVVPSLRYELCSCGAWLGELGAEPTPQLYVEHTVEYMRAVWRVLRKDGTCWLNLGDGYASHDPGGARPGEFLNPNGRPTKKQGEARNRAGTYRPAGLKPKDLILMPYRVVLALQDDGWWVRNQIAWTKNAPMPEPTEDRFTSAWEPIFLLTKSRRYFFDAFAVREPDVAGHASGALARGTNHQPNGRSAFSTNVPFEPGSGRSGRNVWALNPEPFADAHFATQPTEVSRRCISAGTSERGACSKCGAPWERMLSVRGIGPKYRPQAIQAVDGMPDGNARTHNNLGGRYQKWLDQNPVETVGWRPSCRCYDGRYRAEFKQARLSRKRAQRAAWGDWWKRVRKRPGLASWPTAPCLVLDPFGGAGTTLMVAARLGRDSVGVELNDSYATMAANRIRADGGFMVDVQVETL